MRTEAAFCDAVQWLLFAIATVDIMLRNLWFFKIETRHCVVKDRPMILGAIHRDQNALQKTAQDNIL